MACFLDSGGGGGGSVVGVAIIPVATAKCNHLWWCEIAVGFVMVPYVVFVMVPYVVPISC